MCLTNELHAEKGTGAGRWPGGTLGSGPTPWGPWVPGEVQWPWNKSPFSGEQALLGFLA